jgi:hypothetical protein
LQLQIQDVSDCINIIAFHGKVEALYQHELMTTQQCVC